MIITLNNVMTRPLYDLYMENTSLYFTFTIHKTQTIP